MSEGRKSQSQLIARHPIRTGAIGKQIQLLVPGPERGVTCGAAVALLAYVGNLTASRSSSKASRNHELEAHFAQKRFASLWFTIIRYQKIQGIRRLVRAEYCR